MKRRNLIKAYGSTILFSGSYIGIQKPTVGLEFRINNVPEKDVSKINSVQIGFENFNLTPMYLDDTKKAELIIEFNLIDKSIKRRIPAIDLKNGVTKDYSDKIGKIAIDSVKPDGRSVIEGSVNIKIDHTDITEDYTRRFFISGSGFPTTEMFSSPIYQFWAASSTKSDSSKSPMPEVLKSASASVASGYPIIKRQTQGSGNSYDAIQYDGNDYHSYTDDGSLNDSFTLAMLVYPEQYSDSSFIYSWGGGDVVFNVGEGGELGFNLNGSPDPGWGGSALKNDFHTFAWVLTGSGGSVEYYIDGSGVGGDGGIGSYPTSPSGVTHHIGGGSSFRSDSWYQGRIAEVIVSNTAESSSTISEYHNNRL